MQNNNYPTIIRKVKKNDFTIINNQILRNNELSWKAKGILCFLLSLPDDWQLHLIHLQRQASDGIDSLKSGMRELQNAGYIKHIKERNDSGQIIRHIWIIHEEPIPLEERKNPEVDFPLMDLQREKPEVDFPQVVKPPLPSTKEQTNTKEKTTTNKEPIPDKSKPKVVVFSSLEKLKLRDSLKKQISSEHDEKFIDAVVERTLNWTSRKSDESAIRKVIKDFDTWNVIKDKQTYEKENMEFLKSLNHLDGNNVGGSKVSIGYNYIEFSIGTYCQKFEIAYENFIQDVKTYAKQALVLQQNKLKTA